MNLINELKWDPRSVQRSIIRGHTNNSVWVIPKDAYRINDKIVICYKKAWCAIDCTESYSTIYKPSKYYNDALGLASDKATGIRAKEHPIFVLFAYYLQQKSKYPPD